MRVPLEWLKEFVTVRLAPEALAHRLTMAGLEVTGVEVVDGQPVLDLEITPNRADCLSIIGVAREAAAITRQPLKLTAGTRGRGRGTKKAKATRPTSHAPRPRIVIEDRKGCLRYIGRVIEGVTVKPSPAWMQRRLIAAGTRPINNIVDSTNYVLLEHGQPLHAFDYERLAERTIRVRRARAREPITTLDEVSRTLSPEALVIGDGKQAVAVAGIMGGIGSEVTERTTTILLESALFDPVTVRRMARRLGLSSESSYRFERGVDPEGVERASVRAAELIVELAGGAVTAVKDVGRRPAARTSIVLEPQRLNRWLGTSLLPADLRTSLARLSCRIASAGDGPTMRVSVPSFRRDLTQPVDLYEEVARLRGYDRIPASRPVAPVGGAPSEASAAYRQRQSLRALCAGLGLTEVVNWSLVSEPDLLRCRQAVSDAVRLANPLSQEHAFLRPSLLIGLLRAVRHNVAQGAAGVCAFELGHVFRRDSRETTRLGIVLSGMWTRDWRLRESCDFFRLKGLLEALVRRVGGVPPGLTRIQEPWAEPHQAIALSMRGERLGVAGQVARAVTAAFDLEQDVWVAELAVDGLLACGRGDTVVQMPIAFPPVKRDLSILVRDETPFDAIAQTIRDVAGPLAVRVELIDRYTGTQTGAGKHSLTFSIEYRDPARTLTSVEADALHQRVTQTLASRLGAALR